MILDASTLSHFQSCKRRHLLEQRFRVLRWRPKLLFEHWLRRGVFALSNGSAPTPTFSHMKAEFLSACASPGLDLPRGGQSYTQAKDWAACLDIVLRTVSRLSLLTLNHIPPIAISPDHSWRFTSPRDDSGTLHRWIAVSSWSDDELARAAHGWWCFGDMAVARQNLMLHIVEVGSLRKGRRDSCWTRAYRHPTMPSLKLMFRRADGSEAFGGRVPAYIADLPSQSPDEWVDELLRSGLATERIRHILLTCPSEAVCQATVDQILDEARECERLAAVHSMWVTAPMSHSACDGLVPCPWQSVCYSPATTDQDVEELGLYSLRNPSPAAALISADQASSTGQVCLPARSS